nr:MAG TPA: hypothetical protein [Caudoviricetes sp.]DAE47880.1 MAG TPA: hypothetical protein [Caudoviricetes sp.]
MRLLITFATVVSVLWIMILMLLRIVLLLCMSVRVSSFIVIVLGLWFL